MDQSMLSFVMSHLPNEWDDVSVYSESFFLFTLSTHSREYQKVERYFNGKSINQIQRVQNPFQYGRYMLRREMLQTAYEKVVFHGVHQSDLTTALKFNCDYRRYVRRYQGTYENGKHPIFFNSFSDLLKTTTHPITDLRVLVLKVLNNTPTSQCDYYIEYVVKCY